jgi:hypothetical protein
MSATRIKRHSDWAHKNGSQLLEMTRIARDLDGYVHTPNGFLSREGYEECRLAHPEVALPAHSALPLLDSRDARPLLQLQ